MIFMKTKDIRNMTPEERIKAYNDLRLEYMKEKGKILVGGVPENPGRVKMLRRDMARILTVINEEKLKNKRGN